ncbi:major facilitator superfamily transporter [Tritrichomonas foetus]|uniref:Major facilitator superfamily transporter n=1 Tax=Tritrichomonas foetus TaxID=1144522 RepID=A0A1J4JL78_9EUKA|nr:major facilitator superfamily transporter [Tritrichomonas foetus]|eukprot:OHS99864.1 major facilitator superfamily transporter [Tritrichomonas foetus]
MWEWFNNGPRFTAAIGSVIFYPFVTRFGRQLSISLGALINGILYFLIFPVNENRMLYILIVRLIHGILWGFMSSTSLVYLFEIAPANAYGFTGCMHQFFIVSGICFINIIGAFFDFKILAISCAAISIIFSGLVWIIRDSPVSAYDKSRRLAKKASHLSHVLKNMEATGHSAANSKNSLNPINSGKKNTLERDVNGLFTKKNMKILFLSIVLFFFQQFCGTNAILANLSSIMAKSGLEINSNLQNLLVNASQLISVMITSLLIDSFGPRIMWCLSAALLFILLIIYAITTTLEVPNYVPVLCIFMYRLSFGFGVGPLTYAIWVQLFTDRARLGGTMIMMSAHWIISWVVVFTFPLLNSTIGEFLTILVYALCTLGSIFFAIFCIPDNRVKETEEMALI